MAGSCGKTWKALRWRPLTEFYTTITTKDLEGKRDNRLVCNQLGFPSPTMHDVKNLHVCMQSKGVGKRNTIFLGKETKGSHLNHSLSYRVKKRPAGQHTQRRQ